MNNPHNPWLLPLLYAFLAGFFVIGALDYFHTAVGVQTYLIEPTTITAAHWPWFLPLQMGVAGLLLVVNWTLTRKVIDRITGPEQMQGPGNKVLIPLASGMILLGYGVSALVQNDPLHLTWYYLLLLGSLVYLVLFHSRHQLLAFLLIGITGICVESVLLEIGYFEYSQKDIFWTGAGLAVACLWLDGNLYSSIDPEVVVDSRLFSPTIGILGKPHQVDHPVDNRIRSFFKGLRPGIKRRCSRHDDPPSIGHCEHILQVNPV